MQRGRLISTGYSDSGQLCQEQEWLSPLCSTEETDGCIMCSQSCPKQPQGEHEVHQATFSGTFSEDVLLNMENI